MWENHQLTLNTKLKVYQACVLSTLLYGSESWTTYARQENHLEGFHLRCLRQIMGIRWQDRVTNTAVLEKAGSLSMHLMLCQRRLWWLGHVHRMEDGQLASGCHPVGRPALRYKDVCKRNLKLTDINPDSWEKLADDRDGWHHAVHDGVRRGEEKMNLQLEDKRTKRKERQQTMDSDQPSNFVCNNCGRLPCSDWTAEPHPALLSTERLIQQGAHHCLPRLKDTY